LLLPQPTRQTARRHTRIRRLCAGLGVLFHLVGYGFMWAVASGRVAAPYWLLVAAGLLASNSLLWLDTTAVVTSMRNFPNERGSIAGELPGFSLPPFWALLRSADNCERNGKGHQGSAAVREGVGV